MAFSASQVKVPPQTCVPLLLTLNFASSKHAKHLNDAQQLSSQQLNIHTNYNAFKASSISSGFARKV